MLLLVVISELMTELGLFPLYLLGQVLDLAEDTLSTHFLGQIVQLVFSLLFAAHHLVDQLFQGKWVVTVLI